MAAVWCEKTLGRGERGERRKERGEERRGRRLGEEDGREGARETQRQRQRDLRAFWDFTAVCTLVLSFYLVWEIIPFLRNWLSFLIFCKGGWQLKDCWTFLRFCTVTCFPSLAVLFFHRLTSSAAAKEDADFLDSRTGLWSQRLLWTREGGNKEVAT